jgi:hypothetical protein
MVGSLNLKIHLMDVATYIYIEREREGEYLHYTYTHSMLDQCIVTRHLCTIHLTGRCPSQARADQDRLMSIMHIGCFFLMRCDHQFW